MFRLALLASFIFSIQILRAQEYAVIQGATDDQSTQLAILVQKDELIFYEIWNKSLARRVNDLAFKRHEKEFSNLAVDHLVITNQNLEHEFELRIYRRGKLVDLRSFGLVDIEDDQVRLALVSCMADFFHKKAIWQSLAKDEPDLILFLGDNVYADRPALLLQEPADEEQLWTRFRETRNRLQIFREPRLIPSLAIWDDHDFGDNGADRSFEHAEDALKNFNVFFPQDDHPMRNMKRGPGVSVYYQAFGIDLFLLDGRKFRSPKGHQDETHLGEEQENWLLENLESSDAFYSILGLGDQFFGGYHQGDSFEGNHPDNFSWLLDELATLPQRFMFLSGDRHYSEVMEIEQAALGYTSLEITSSSMHSAVTPWAMQDFNPRRLMGTKSFNYIMLELKHATDGLESTIRSYDTKGVRIFGYDFLLKPERPL